MYSKWEIKINKSGKNTYIGICLDHKNKSRLMRRIGSSFYLNESDLVPERLTRIIQEAINRIQEKSEINSI